MSRREGGEPPLAPSVEAQSEASQREARLARALRDNLRRRKAARGTASPGPKPDADAD